VKFLYFLQKLRVFRDLGLGPCLQTIWKFSHLINELNVCFFFIFRPSPFENIDARGHREILTSLTLYRKLERGWKKYNDNQPNTSRCSRTSPTETCAIKTSWCYPLPSLLTTNHSPTDEEGTMFCVVCLSSNLPA
jgi:hypothetical protein